MHVTRTLRAQLGMFYLSLYDGTCRSCLDDTTVGSRPTTLQSHTAVRDLLFVPRLGEAVATPAESEGQIASASTVEWPVHSTISLSGSGLHLWAVAALCDEDKAAVKPSLAVPVFARKVDGQAKLTSARDATLGSDRLGYLSAQPSSLDPLTRRGHLPLSRNRLEALLYVREDIGLRHYPEPFLPNCGNRRSRDLLRTLRARH